MSNTTLLLRKFADMLKQAQPGTSSAATGQTVRLTTWNLRARIRQSWPAIKFLLGLLFVAFSSASSVDGVRVDLSRFIMRLEHDGLLQHGWQVAVFGIGLGLLAAVIIFFGEVITAEHEQWFWYLLFLAADVRYTHRWSSYAVYAFDESWFATIISAVLAVVIAHFGEQWLLGRRRKGWVKRLFLLQWGRV